MKYFGRDLEVLPYCTKFECKSSKKGKHLVTPKKKKNKKKKVIIKGKNKKKQDKWISIQKTIKKQKKKPHPYGFSRRKQFKHKQFFNNARSSSKKIIRF